MIVEFSVQNFRSIKELQTISFAATGLKSAEEYSHIDADNISEQAGQKLFKTIGVYGANASGKSNVLKALEHFIQVINRPPSAQSNLASLCDPFLYQEHIESSESFFQIVLIIKDVKYRYGFTTKKSPVGNIDGKSDYSAEVITNEWLYANKSKNMSPLFERAGNEVTKNNLKNKGKVPDSLPYLHSLFLTHAAAFDSEGDCKKLCDYFSWVCVNTHDNQEKFRWMSLFHIESTYSDSKKEILHLLSVFNLKYDDVVLLKDTEINPPISHFPSEKILLKKRCRIGEKESLVDLNLKHHESSGTQKLFDLVGLLFSAFRHSTPNLLVLDEIDGNFHPSLLIKLVGLFNDPKINQANAQLLFTSHDTNLMSPAIMRRDQFYFAEKRDDYSSRIYSLADLRGIRNDADFAKQYLAGYYGALPVLEDYNQEENQEDNQ